MSVYDITASVPAVIAEITGGSPVLYVREPNGALIARKAGTDRKYYHFDELGSTLFLTDAGAVQTDKYVYNAFGGVITRTGSTNQPYQYIGQYGYYTHWQDTNNLYILTNVGHYCSNTSRMLRGHQYSHQLNEYHVSMLDNKKNLNNDNKMIWQCISRALINECYGKTHRELATCVARAIKKCGIEWAVDNCPKLLCDLPLPNGYVNPFCNNGINPCDRHDYDYEGDCCELKYYCCIIERPNSLGVYSCYLDSIICKHKNCASK